MFQALLYSSIYIAKDEELKAQVIRWRTFIIDVFILPQAWTLLILSTTVRNSLRRSAASVFGWPKQDSRVNVIAVVAASEMRSRSPARTDVA